jgi:phosphoglycolate phosphatase
MKPFELLIFDWDGTLADSVGEIVLSMHEAIAKMNLPAKEDSEIRDLIGLGLAEGLARLFPDVDPVTRQMLLLRYKARYIEQGRLQGASLFPGVKEALKVLYYQRYRLTVATGKSRDGLNKALKAHSAVAAMMVATRCADETESKPSPLMLNQILAEQHVDATQALMIGDSEYDIAMARAINMPAIGVLSGVHSGERLLRAGAMALMGSVVDLVPWLHNVQTYGLKTTLDNPLIGGAESLQWGKTFQ